MRIVVSAMDDRGLDGLCSPHFGRCPYFATIEAEGDTITAVEMISNPYYGNHQPGQVPAFVAGLEPQVMLSGGMGARAVELFRGYGIEPVTGAAGTVGGVVRAYLQGALQGANGCSHEHGEHAGEHSHDCGATEVGHDAEHLSTQMRRLETQLSEVEARLSVLRKKQ